ncbi:hypothetical protein AAON49_09930 [Pseudotenacibaculum sp. MALMAid0570]|uniref:hypothetical protein n=1 Tax=Pseudotenacibaculum sp. MALMAid0570 TaxID=3143938 RepID=UPI0032DE7199
MTIKQTTYRTLIGVKEIVDFPKKQYAQWIVYLDNKPKYHINCFDQKAESNIILNGLVLSAQKAIEDILRDINKRQRINLSIKRAPLIQIPIKTEIKDLELKPLPIQWLN